MKLLVTTLSTVLLLLCLSGTLEGRQYRYRRDVSAATTTEDIQGQEATQATTTASPDTPTEETDPEDDPEAAMQHSDLVTSASSHGQRVVSIGPFTGNPFSRRRPVQNFRRPIYSGRYTLPYSSAFNPRNTGGIRNTEDDFIRGRSRGSDFVSHVPYGYQVPHRSTTSQVPHDSGSGVTRDFNGPQTTPVPPVATDPPFDVDPRSNPAPPPFGNPQDQTFFRESFPFVRHVNHFASRDGSLVNRHKLLNNNDLKSSSSDAFVNQDPIHSRPGPPFVDQVSAFQPAQPFVNPNAQTRDTAVPNNLVYYNNQIYRSAHSPSVVNREGRVVNQDSVNDDRTGQCTAHGDYSNSYFPHNNQAGHFVDPNGQLVNRRGSFMNRGGQYGTSYLPFVNPSMSATTHQASFVNHDRSYDFQPFGPSEPFLNATSMFNVYSNPYVNPANGQFQSFVNPHANTVLPYAQRMTSPYNHASFNNQGNQFPNPATSFVNPYLSTMSRDQSFMYRQGPFVNSDTSFDNPNPHLVNRGHVNPNMPPYSYYGPPKHQDTPFVNPSASSAGRNGAFVNPGTPSLNTDSYGRSNSGNHYNTGYGK